jgi:NAD(P)-dependent dehydrogenase (short-subunit alcohol dehydrogenase family)
VHYDRALACGTGHHERVRSGAPDKPRTLNSRTLRGTPSSVCGKIAVVTGAGSGIGRALALELGRRGARVAVCDINAEALRATAAMLDEQRTPLHEQALDVADRREVQDYAAAVAAHFGAVHQIYNNAGIAFRRPVLESEYADYERVLAINLWGVIHGTKEFLPHLVASGDGHVVNISSLNGALAQADMSHYCTSKFAVRGFTESLSIEMRTAGLPVKVSCVHPGGIKTNIADAAMADARRRGLPFTDEDERRRRTYNEKLLRMDPRQAATIIIDGVEAGRTRIIVGNDARALDAVVRLLPARYQRVAAALERRVMSRA